MSLSVHPGPTSHVDESNYSSSVIMVICSYALIQLQVEAKLYRLEQPDSLSPLTSDHSGIEKNRQRHALSTRIENTMMGIMTIVTDFSNY